MRGPCSRSNPRVAAQAANSSSGAGLRPSAFATTTANNVDTTEVVNARAAAARRIGGVDTTVGRPVHTILSLGAELFVIFAGRYSDVPFSSKVGTSLRFVQREYTLALSVESPATTTCLKYQSPGPARSRRPGANAAQAGRADPPPPAGLSDQPTSSGKRRRPRSGHFAQLLPQWSDR
jgi:hypothetical protein